VQVHRRIVAKPFYLKKGIEHISTGDLISADVSNSFRNLPEENDTTHFPSDHPSSTKNKSKTVIQEENT
jgi:hypothetical protein